MLERDWCAFAVISRSGIVASFERTVGVDLLLEDVAVHSLATRGVMLDMEVAHDLFSARGLLGYERSGGDARLAEREAGRPTSESSGEIDFKHESLPFMGRLDLYHRQAMSVLNSNAQLRDASCVPLLFAGPYAALPGLADLVGQAFHRKVIVPDKPAEVMIRGAQKILADLSWILSNDKSSPKANSSKISGANPKERH